MIENGDNNLLIELYILSTSNCNVKWSNRNTSNLPSLLFVFMRQKKKKKKREEKRREALLDVEADRCVIRFLLHFQPSHLSNT
jgi:hypothetical protein